MLARLGALCRAMVHARRRAVARAALRAIVLVGALVVAGRPSSTNADPAADKRPIGRTGNPDPLSPELAGVRRDVLAATRRIDPGPASKKPKAPPPAPKLRPQDLHQVQAEARARRQALDDPQAQRKRDDSRTKFRDRSRAQALDVMRESFPGLLDAMSVDPLPLRKDEQVVAYPTATSALVQKDGEPSPQLLDSTLPLQSSVGSGKPFACEKSSARSVSTFRSSARRRARPGSLWSAISAPLTR